MAASSLRKRRLSISVGLAGADGVREGGRFNSTAGLPQHTHTHTRALILHFVCVCVCRVDV